MNDDQCKKQFHWQFVEEKYLALGDHASNLLIQLLQNKVLPAVIQPTQSFYEAITTDVVAVVDFSHFRHSLITLT